MSEATDQLSEQVRGYVGESVWVEIKDGRISEYDAVAREVERLLGLDEADMHIDWLNVHARRVVAGVTNDQTFRDRSTSKHPRRPVRLVRDAVRLGDAIAVLVASARPLNATALKVRNVLLEKVGQFDGLHLRTSSFMYCSRDIP